MRMKVYQELVKLWLFNCFGIVIMNDKTERNFRFLEEALELVQSLGCTEAEAADLVKYVYGRPIGEPKQEVGGVAVTLTALCQANGIDLDSAAQEEIVRIEQPAIMEKIRIKQASKPNRGPRPQ